MLLKRLTVFIAMLAAVFVIGAAAAGAEAEYRWTEHNVIEIRGVCASKKAGVNVVVQILKPGEDLSTVTPGNMKDTVAYHNQIKSDQGGNYSLTARVDTDLESRIAVVRESDGASVQVIAVEPSNLTAEAVMDAPGHMYYDCTQIPVKIKTSKSGIFNVSVKLTDEAGLFNSEVTKAFGGVATDGDNMLHITLDLGNDAMQYGVFNAEFTVFQQGQPGVSCRTQFSVSRGSEKGEENSRVGAAQHFFSNQRTGDIDTELDMMQKAGIKLQRQSVYWDTFEKEKNDYKFNERTQQYFELLGEKRLTGIVQVYGGNPLYYPKNEDGSYQRDEDGNLIDYPPNSVEGLKAFGDYAYNLALQTKDYADCYEIWNEYNLKSFNPRNLGASCYADMLKAVYGRIHDANPDAVVIGMALANYGDPAIAWAREVLEAGKGEIMMDAVSCHPYRLPESAESEAYIKKLKALFAEYGYDDIKVYVTETGYSTGAAGVDGLEQAKRHIRNLALLSDDAEQVYIYNAFEKQNTTDVEHGYGIVKGQIDENEPYYAKPAYVAVACFNKLTGNYARVVQESASGGIYKVRFDKKDGTNCWVLWSTNRGGQIYVIDTGYTNVDMYDIFGNCTALADADGKYSLKLSDSPVYIEAKPSAAVRYTDDMGFAVSRISDTKVINVNVDIRVPIADAKIYTASYCGGVMKECVQTQASAGTRTITLDAADVDRIAVFYWNGNSMKPIMEKKFDELVKQPVE